MIHINISHLISSKMVLFSLFFNPTFPRIMHSTTLNNMDIKHLNKVCFGAILLYENGFNLGKEGKQSKHFAKNSLQGHVIFGSRYSLKNLITSMNQNYFHPKLTIFYFIFRNIFRRISTRN